MPKVLTPCPPKKYCRICEARLDAVFGSAHKTAKYRHQAAEAGAACRIAILAGRLDLVGPLATRAASFAAMV
jgi:hypothetical protein